MPQGRRKAPFSGKAKKQQMQAKKQRKTVLIGILKSKITNRSQSILYFYKIYVKLEIAPKIWRMLKAAKVFRASIKCLDHLDEIDTTCNFSKKLEKKCSKGRRRPGKQLK